MKRNWIVISLMFLLTAALWAQVGTTANPPAGDKTGACACCNHQAKAGDAATSDCCGGKDGMACARKGGEGCCDGMKGMKKDAAQTTTAAASCGKDCCGKECGKDCCKDGKCEMAKNGKKCCDHSPATTEGK